MDRVGAGVVGLGSNGRAFVLGYQQNEEAEVVCACDMTEAPEYRR